MEALKAKLLGPNAPSSKSEAWFALEKFFRKHEIQVVDDIDTAQVVIFFEVEPRLVRGKFFSSIPREKRILIIQEPSVVWRPNYKKRYLKKFGKVVSPGRVTSGELAPYWPVKFPVRLRNWSDADRSEKFIIVASDKLSFWAGELYSLRRRAAHLLEDVVVAGRGWDSNRVRKLAKAFKEFLIFLRNPGRPSGRALSLFFKRVPSYIGSPIDKYESLEKHKYSLVIENSQEYLSEKLIEALLGGCVPIYVGPNPVDFGIPRELVIPSPPTLSGIRDAQLRAKSLDLQAWSKAREAWLSSSNVVERFSYDRVWKEVVDHLSSLTSRPQREL